MIIIKTVIIAFWLCDLASFVGDIITDFKFKNNRLNAIKDIIVYSLIYYFLLYFFAF